MAYAQPNVIADEDESLEASSRDLPPLRDANLRGRRISSAALREIESLRAINTQLLRDLAAMNSSWYCLVCRIRFR